MIAKTYKMARRIAVAVVGCTVLTVGIALIVLPGPAFVVIPIGLAILSVEFAWARLWLKKVRRTISERTAGSRAERAENHRDRASR
jgi:tellurite resistance protein TerC